MPVGETHLTRAPRRRCPRPAGILVDPASIPAIRRCRQRHRLRDRAHRGGLDPDPLQHLAAHPDQPDDDRVDLRVDGDRDDEVAGPHDGARPAGLARGPAGAASSTRPSSASSATRSPTVERLSPVSWRESRARQSPAPVHEAEHGRQVGAAQSIRSPAARLPNAIQLGHGGHAPTLMDRMRPAVTRVRGGRARVSVEA